MTDAEIIKGINYCANVEYRKNCDNCPIKAVCDSEDYGAIKLVNDLINRQKAEINKLTYQVNRLKKYDEERDIRLHARLTATARAEAIKEFAEKLKQAFHIEEIWDGEDEYWYETIDCEDIDNLAKEMVSDSK